AAFPTSTVTPRALPVALSRVAQKGEAAGPTPIATRSAPFGATSLVDTTGALEQAARSSGARREVARRCMREDRQVDEPRILARTTSLNGVAARRLGRLEVVDMEADHAAAPVVEGEEGVGEEEGREIKPHNRRRKDGLDRGLPRCYPSNTMPSTAKKSRTSTTSLKIPSHLKATITRFASDEGMTPHGYLLSL